MKSFAAAAIAATTASAFDAVAIPDFVAGFIYGMTGDNHLTEIEACYQGGSQVVDDSQIAIGDFKAGQYFAGIKEAGVVWNDLSSAMTTCQGMDEDIAAIEAWAQIFEHPTQLAETVGKRWLLHGRKIKADIAQEEADWSAGKYFDAGKDTALALTEAVGPIQTTSAQNLDIAAPFLFIGGMLDVLVQDNHLDEIQTCALDADGVVKDVEELLADFEGGHMIKAARMAKKVVGEFPVTLAACEGMGDDLTALENWAAIFTQPKHLAEDIAKSMVFHKKAIDADISTIKTDWAAKEYFQAGEAAGDLLYVAVGPVQQPTEVAETVVGMDLMALPDFAAGFVYGMVGENHLAEMESCYAGVEPLYTYLHAALLDIEGFHIIKAMEQLEQFVYHFQLDVAPCTQMGDDIQAIETWATIFKNPSELVATATKHYLLHKKAITTDIATVKTDWSEGTYFAAGRSAADLVTVLVGPIE